MSEAGADRDVLVIGGANIDVFGAPEQGELQADSTPGRIWEAAGGVGRNIAANLARLGHPTRLLSVVGNDRRGDWLLEQTRQAGVDVDSVRRHDRLPTAAYLAIADARGETSRAIADMRIMERFEFSANGDEWAMIERSRVLVVDCNLPGAAIDSALRGAARAAVPVFVDGVSAAKVGRVSECLDRIHTLKINRLECAALTGVDPAEPGWRDRAAAQLLRAGVSRVVISMGAAGVRYTDSQRSFESAIEANASGNDTGAGDALTAGLVSAWLRALDVDRQLRFALGCAALALDADEAVPPQLSIARVDRWTSRNS